MSLKKLKADLSFGEDSEIDVKKTLEQKGYTVEMTSKTALTDFILKKWKVIYHAELKTRKCERWDYPDTMIWGNKLAEAWKLFYKTGQETIFFFKFTDWLFSYNPIQEYRTEYKAWRWDRGSIDWKKGWVFIDNKNLKLIN